MTVCIAVHSVKDNCIVTVSDTKISTVDMSIDRGAIKGYAVGKNWTVQYAGNDISEVTPIITNVKKLLHGSENYSLEQITGALVGAYSRQLSLNSEAAFLKPIGYTLEDFKKYGYVQLGNETFTRILSSIQDNSLDLELLVSGFDNDKAHIFTVRSPGKLTYFSEIGFWAIGSGQTNALGSFFNSSSPRFLSKEDLLYRACEAKFNAENADGVGPSTVALFVYPNGQKCPVLYNDINEIKPLWEKTRVLDVPADARAKAKEIIEKMWWRMTQAETPTPSASQMSGQAR